jgi:hypothetical protein
LEGKYRFIKQAIKTFENAYTDWEIISLLNIFNKKIQNIKIYSFIKFFKILKYFLNIIDYFCNFFLSIQQFLMILYYNIAYKNNNNSYNVNIILFDTGKHKFINTLFNLFVNNYYIMDFYTKNSKIMASSASKQYNIFKIY